MHDQRLRRGHGLRLHPDRLRRRQRVHGGHLRYRHRLRLHADRLRRQRRLHHRHLRHGTGCVYTPIVCDDGDVCTADSCSDGACVYDPIEGCGSVCTSTDNPKNLAYWKKQCNPHGQGGGDPITLADVACVASQGDLFASADEVKDVCDVLAGDVGISNSCTRTNAQLMALALNICHQRVCDSTSIDSNYSDNTTVGESYDEADDLLERPDRQRRRVQTSHPISTAAGRYGARVPAARETASSRRTGGSGRSGPLK